MKVKNKEVVTFIGLEWQEPQWEFDHPTVILFPVVKYSPNGESAEKMIEDICIDLCINADTGEDYPDEDVTKEFEWRRWNLKIMKNVAKQRLQGLDTWKTKCARVVAKTVRFYIRDGEMSFSDVKTKSN